MKDILRVLAIFAVCIVLALAVVLFCGGCAAEDPRVTDPDGISYGLYNMVEIGDGLWYDSSTRIVYWWNGCIEPGYQSSTSPAPYYAPNGLPYKYNPITKEFEEIEA